MVSALRDSLEGLFGRGTEPRYYDTFNRYANGYHTAGSLFPLSNVFIEPRFLPLPQISDPTIQDETLYVYDVVPKFHDLPALYAPYNVESLSIADLRNGNRHLCLLGRLGSGKSTALALIGLAASGAIQTAKVDLLQDDVFEDEIKGLEQAEKDKQIQKRRDLQARAVEQLKVAKRQSAIGKPTDSQAEPVNFTQLLPILINLADVDLRLESYALLPGNTAIDPAEPVIRALQGHMPGFSSSMPGLIYRRLSAGTCLLLVDGYDMLSPSERAVKLVWLKQFREQYGANFIIVAGPEAGYDSLAQSGFTPIFLRAWSDADINSFADQWIAAWSGISAMKKGMISDEVVTRVHTDNRARRPLDLALKFWSACAGDEREVGRRGWYEFYSRQSGGKTTLKPDQTDLAYRIAAAILDADYGSISREGIKALAQEALRGGDSSATRMITQSEESVNRIIAPELGLLRQDGAGQYNFVHPLVTAFLGGESLKNADPAVIAVRANARGWDEAFAFAAANVKIDNAVAQRMTTTPDLLYSGLFTLVHWLVDAPSDAAWRGEVLKRLGVALMGATQFPRLRERATAALVTTRDKNVKMIFGQALKSPNITTRYLACLGLGAFGDSDAYAPLNKALNDEDLNVRIAAIIALGALGSDDALNTIAGRLESGEQEERQATAEVFAGMPGSGHATLRDAITHPDTMVRHAAVNGLARIKAAWALALLYKTLLEDEQWYVRNAAETKFTEADANERYIALQLPEAHAMRWLIAWAATRGEGVPEGPVARNMLIRAMQEGTPRIRIAAARALVSLGHVPALKPLYAQLRDQDEVIRASAYSTLSDLQQRLGSPLPAVL